MVDTLFWFQLDIGLSAYDYQRAKGLSIEQRAVLDKAVGEFIVSLLNDSMKAQVPEYKPPGSSRDYVNNVEKTANQPPENR